jgi:hypothetical protein
MMTSPGNFLRCLESVLSRDRRDGTRRGFLVSTSPRTDRRIAILRNLQCTANLNVESWQVSFRNPCSCRLASDITAAGN